MLITKLYVIGGYLFYTSHSFHGNNNIINVKRVTQCHISKNLQAYLLHTYCGYPTTSLIID